MTSWYEALGVRVSQERLKVVLNLTCWIPFDILRQGLHELLVAKDDGYQTAPQPGEIFSACRRVASRAGGLEWNVKAGAWSEPDWSRASRRLLAAGKPRKRRTGLVQTVDGTTLRDLLGDPTAPSWEAMKGEQA